MSKQLIIYLASVGTLGLILAIYLRVKFHRLEASRTKAVEDLKRFVAVRTQIPEMTRSAPSKERALESIATRFSIMRRVSTPLVLIMVGVLIGAPFLGNIPAAALTLLATALTIVLGIAAKPLLENVIAGLMISFSQPLRIGDIVVLEGQYGIIEEINLTYTIIKVWDWRRYVIPNQRLLQIEYENHSIVDKWQWSYVAFWVDYDADLELVQRLACDAVRASSHNVAEHAPGFWIIDLNKEGIVCWVAGWVSHPLDAWSLKHDTRKNLVRMFKERGIRAHLYHVEGPVPGRPAPGRPPAVAGRDSAA